MAGLDSPTNVIHVTMNSFVTESSYLTLTVVLTYRLETEIRRLSQLDFFLVSLDSTAMSITLRSSSERDPPTSG